MPIKTSILILLLCSAQSLIAQSKLNVVLKNELDSILSMDQGLRMYLVGQPTPAQKDSIEKATGYSKTELSNNNIWKIINYHDSLNLIQVERIIAQYGYPGKSLVGSPTNEAAWFVIQHSSKIAEYFPLIEKAGKKKEIPFMLVAKMQDRLLMAEEKEQIYGTQAVSRNRIESTTGASVQSYFVWPIKNPKEVNKRRKKAGFSTTVEENAKRMDIEYEVVTLKQIQANESSK